MTQNYICNTCKKKFSRKWNAYRHNTTVHAGLSSILPTDTVRIVHNKELNSKETVDEVDQDILYDQIILDLFGKMLQDFEELEILLSHKTDNEKNKTLSQMLVVSLATRDPVKSLRDSVTFCRSLKAKSKFVNYVSKNMNNNQIMAEFLLKNAVKNNPWINKGNRL